MPISLLPSNENIDGDHAYRFKNFLEKQFSFTNKKEKTHKKHTHTHTHLFNRIFVAATTPPPSETIQKKGFNQRCAPPPPRHPDTPEIKAGRLRSCLWWSLVDSFQDTHEMVDVVEWFRNLCLKNMRMVSFFFRN